MRLIDADALQKAMFSYYPCINEHSCKWNYSGDTLMDYEVADLIEDCIGNAPTIETEPVKWIPVTERLPENEQDVLITVRRKHYCKPGEYIRFVVKAFYTDGKHDTDHSAYIWFDGMEYDEESDAYKIPEGWWESIEYGEEFQAVGDSVTHWMPLPQPPKDGGADND